VGLKNFNGYLYENELTAKELPMFFSPKLIDMFKSIDNPISKELLALVGSDNRFQFSYFDLTKDLDTLSFLPPNRATRLEGITEQDLTAPSPSSVVWGEKYRQPMRIGAFVPRVLNKYAGSKELENFVHQFKAKLDAQNYKIRLVRGEELRAWYHVKNYFNPTPGIEEAPEEGVMDVITPLMKSCLKQAEKQGFFDIYCANPEKCGLLIMTNSDNKLVCRAIVWDEVFVVENPQNPAKGTFMDRIYYTNESDVHIFINYCKEKGWWWKTNQAKDCLTYVVNGKVSDKQMTTKLPNHGMFNTFPYMDTMCYYTPDSGRLSTTRGKPALNPKTGQVMERYMLKSAKGGAKRLSQSK